MPESVLGALEVAGVGGEDGEVGHHLEVAWIGLEGVLERFARAPLVAEKVERRTEILVRAGIARVRGDGAPEGVGGGGVVSALERGDAALRVGVLPRPQVGHLREPRILDRDRALAATSQRRSGLLLPPQAAIGGGQLEVDLRRPRLQSEDLLESGGRGGEVPAV